MSTDRHETPMLEVAILLAGALLHSSQVGPTLMEGGSIVFLPLHLAPFALLYWQGRSQRSHTDKSPILTAGSLSALITIAVGSYGYHVSIESRSVLAPIGLLLTPLALCLGAPLLRAILTAHQEHARNR